MVNERFQVARVDDVGLGIIREQHTHFAVIEFNTSGHRWRLVVDNDDYDIVDEVHLGYQELE